MLTQLSTLKSRLGILDTDTTNDALLTDAIKAVSARFDAECNRTFARTEDAIYEFPAEALEISCPCQPIESIARFELKTSEAGGWVEQPGVDYLVRRACVISLAAALGNSRAQGRVIYTGGYVLPGTQAATGQTSLPADLEHAAIEQVAYWFQHRDRLGLQRIWEYHATYRQFAALDLLESVRAVLEKHARWNP
ncbi:MAG TPA: hypothetical protein VL361_11210 [Candidatus Limnocylindrales bacterium]|jgi:hypothetical protein|nr:hypothetical protein [Candidatus Limnocylindrales bacterium]